MNLRFIIGAGLGVGVGILVLMLGYLTDTPDEVIWSLLIVQWTGVGILIGGAGIR